MHWYVWVHLGCAVVTALAILGVRRPDPVKSLLLLAIAPLWLTLQAAGAIIKTVEEYRRQKRLRARTLQRLEDRDRP